MDLVLNHTHVEKIEYVLIKISCILNLIIIYSVNIHTYIINNILPNDSILNYKSYVNDS